MQRWGKINEKTFRDLGSGFDYCPINYGRTSTKPVPREIKINLVAYLIISKHNNYININLITLGEWRNLVDALDSKARG